MDERSLEGFLDDARSGRLSRRDVIGWGLRLGVATPTVAALAAMAPRTLAATGTGNSPAVARAQSDDTFLALSTYLATDIDPHSSYDTMGSVVCLACYEMLVQYKGDSTSELAPMLAESWEASPDNTTFTFKLPANATFHDGSPCDANAVKQSFVRFRRLELGPYLVLQRFCDNPEEQIVVVDPATIQFKLGTPQPIFLEAMASSYGPYVVSPSAVDANKTADDPYAHEWFKENAVGTGPYQLANYEISSKAEFKKFDAYHGGWDGDHFSQIVVRPVAEDATRRQLLESGDADGATNNLTPEDYEALKAGGKLQVLTYPTTRVDWSIMNTAKLSKEARQGLCYAFPYQQVVDGAYKGQLKRTGPIPSTVKGYDPNVFLYPTDLDKAKQLLASGGIKEGDSIEYTIGSEIEVDKTVAQLFQASLSQIGITLEISQVDGATLNDLILGDAPAEERPAMIGSWAWWPDYNDPWNQLAPNFLKISSGGGGSNAGFYVNDRFEELMDQAAHYTDEAQLNELMKEAQNILTEQDPPAIFFGERQYTTVLKQGIQGFVANPLYLDCYNFYGMSRA